MKLEILFTLIITILFLNLNAQTTFQKTYGGTGSDSGNSVQQTTDMGYIIVGSTNSFGAGSSDIYLIKTDTNGDTLWTKTYGGAGLEYGKSVRQTNDTGYIVLGVTKSFGAGDQDLYLIKTDTNGDTLWTKTIGGALYDSGNSIQQTSDGGYIITGKMGRYDTYYNSDVYLIKISDAGDLLWTKIYGGTDNDEGHSIQQTFDEGYIITGTTTTFGAGQGDIYLIKTNDHGDTLWTKTFGGVDTEWGRSVLQTTDSSYIIAGVTNSFGTGAFDIYLIKTDVNGHLLWSRSYGGSDEDIGYSVQQTNDLGFIIIGKTQSFGAGYSDIYLIKTNANGDTLWTKTYGGIYSDMSGSVQQTSDLGYIITGAEESFGTGELDVYLIKTDTNGNSGCNESSTNTIVTSPSTITNIPAIIMSEGIGTVMTSPPTIVSNTTTIISVLCPSNSIQKENNTLNSIQMYPNPFSTYVTVEFNNPKKEKHILTIFNSSGQLVRKINSIAGEKIIIERNNLISGLYFFQLRSDKEIIGTMKLIVE